MSRGGDAHRGRIAPATLISNFAYSGAHADAEVVENAQKGAKVYKDQAIVFAALLVPAGAPCSVQPNSATISGLVLIWVIAS